MKNLQAKITTYAGIEYRSRLEAKWSRFFEYLQIPFVYEPYKFTFPADDDEHYLYYMPDFWLPVQRCWIEIKGEQPTRIEEKKAVLLSCATDYPVYIFYGDVPISSLMDDIFAYLGGRSSDSARLYLQNENISNPFTYTDHKYLWCICKKCGMLGIEYEGRSERLPCGCYSKKEKVRSFNDPLLLKAYNEAWQVAYDGK